MDRKKFIISSSFLAAGALAARGKSSSNVSEQEKAPVLTVAHITDVHIRDAENAPERFKKCLQEIVSKHKPDFFLNGGDAIHDASYNDVKREQVTGQWQVWDECISVVRNYEVHSCIGNHDIWWAAPDKKDLMYGKDYVTKRLLMPHRYYSFSKKGWHFFILDGNNSNVSLDDEQYEWLESSLKNLPADSPVLLMSHYPILGTTQVLVGGGHSDCKKLKDLFYRHPDKIRICLSGHNHLSDKTMYNTVMYCCNGAMSGYWWGQGDKESAGPGYYLETPPGYAILKLYADGTVENEYIAHHY